MSRRSTTISTIWLCMAMVAGTASVSFGQSPYFRVQTHTVLNATSWRGDFPMSPKYPCIRIVEHRSSYGYSAFSNDTYTILGNHGVRLADHKGLFEFFEEEPTANFTILNNGRRIEHRHIADDVGKWRDSLSDALAGRNPAPPEAADDDEKDAE